MSYTPLVRKWSGQFMKNLLPTLLVVLCSYSSLYFPVISLDARGHLALLRFFQDVLVLHNHVIMFPSILNVFLLNDGIRRNIPKLGYPTLLDIWIFGCFLATFLIRFFCSSLWFPLHFLTLPPPASSSCWCSATRPSARCPPRRRSRESLTSSSPGSSPSSPSPSSSS